MYNARVLEHFTLPHHQGRVANADVIGQEGIPGEGPFMTISLRLDSEKIVEAGFETYGCPAAVACGSWLTQWLEGKELSMASRIEAQDIALMVGGLPLGKEHCAQLASGALQAALEQWHQRRTGNQPDEADSCANG